MSVTFEQVMEAVRAGDVEFVKEHLFREPDDNDIRWALVEAQAARIRELEALCSDVKDHLDHPDQRSRRAWSLIGRLEGALGTGIDEVSE